MATVETILASIFSTVPELHSGQLGLLAGVLVGICYWQGYRRASISLLSAFYLLALGIVPASTRGLAVVQDQPWYFCTLLVGTSLLAIATRAAWTSVSLASRRRSLAIGERPSE